MVSLNEDQDQIVQFFNGPVIPTLLPALSEHPSMMAVPEKQLQEGAVSLNPILNADPVWGAVCQAVGATDHNRVGL